MQKTLTVAILAGLVGMTAAARAQEAKEVRPQIGPRPYTVSLGLTAAGERSQRSISAGGFWLRGGTVDATLLARPGYGVKAAVNLGFSPRVVPGINVDTATFLAGPVYDRPLGQLLGSQRAVFKPLHLFGEGLVGGVHGYNGVYPAAGGSTTSANALAVQAGGGLNLDWKQRGGLRLLQVDYVRTTLPNNGNNQQNNLRIGFGANIRLW